MLIYSTLKFLLITYANAHKFTSHIFLIKIVTKSSLCVIKNKLYKSTTSKNQSSECNGETVCGTCPQTQSKRFCHSHTHSFLTH